MPQFSVKGPIVLEALATAGPFVVAPESGGSLTPIAAIPIKAAALAIAARSRMK